MGMGDVKGKVLPKVSLLSKSVNNNSIVSRYFTPYSCHETHAVTGTCCVASSCLIAGTVGFRLLNKKENLNLNTINTLRNKFKCSVGYSGHENSVSPSLYAFLLGASVIERHITLDRSMWGTDQSASLSEPGIKNLVELINKSQTILGNGIKTKSKEDKKLEKKFRYWL